MVQLLGGCMQLTVEQQRAVETYYDFAVRSAHALVRPTRAYDRRWTDADTVSVAHGAICKAVLSYDPRKGTTLKTWIGNVVRMQISHAVRSHKRVHGQERQLSEDAIAVWDDTPRFELEDLLTVLPERDRRIFTLYALDGFHMEDIRKVLGVSRQRVHQIVVKCRKRLARVLGCSDWSNSATKRVKRSTAIRTLPQARTAGMVLAS